MKTILNFFALTVLCVTLIYSPHSSAQNFADGQMPDTFLKDADSYAYRIAFSPDSTTLASGSSDNTVKLWDVATATIKDTLEGHTDSVNSIAFSPDGKTLASGSSDNTVKLWDVATATIKDTLEGHTDSVNSIAFSPNGQTLASGSSDNTIRLWDVMTGEHLQTRSGQQSWDNKYSFSNYRGKAWGIFTVAFSPDGSTLAIGEGITNGIYYQDHTSFWLIQNVISLWDLDSGAITPLRSPLSSKPFWIGQPYHGFKDSGSNEVDVSVSNCSFSPDGSTLACSVYRSSRFYIESHLNFEEELSLKFDLDNISYPGAIEITSSNKMTLRETAIELWDVTSGTLKATLKGHTREITSVAFSPDGRTLASGSRDDTVKLWDVTRQPKVPKATLSIHGDDVTSVALSPDGKLFASSSYDGAIRLWKSLPPANVDGVVNIADLIEVAQNFGQVGENEADINGDGIVNIIDLILVAVALGEVAGAPAAHAEASSMLTAEEVTQWLIEAKQLQTADPSYLHGILVLEQLLAVLTPKKTALLANYPNPFNPETWIPYQVAEPSDVTLTIYDINGHVVRALDLGHRRAGIYHNRSRAAHWDGRNAQGEPVASGVYYYTLTAGDFTATRKMLIRK